MSDCQIADLTDGSAFPFAGILLLLGRQCARHPFKAPCFGPNDIKHALVCLPRLVTQKMSEFATHCCRCRDGSYIAAGFQVCEMALEVLYACGQQFQLPCQASSFRAVSHQCNPGAQRTGSQNPEMTMRFSLARAQRIYHNLGSQEPRVTCKSACAAQPEHHVEPLAGGSGPDL